MFADIKFDELGEARAWFEDERKRDGTTDGAHALATGVMPRGSGQRSGSRDRGDVEAGVVVITPSATAEATITISIISSSGLHSPSRNISSSPDTCMQSVEQ